MTLSRDFYSRDGRLVAQELLGKLLVRRTPEGVRSGMIVETEAYLGEIDDAAHSYGNLRSSRTDILFGEGGYAYVYLIYGMYCCLNASVNVVGKPEAVLIRALEPMDGIDEMVTARSRSNRKGGTADIISLCSGPGKLCQAMGISRADYGTDLCGDELYIKEYREFAPEQIGVSPRINIDYAEESRDQLWRYFLKDNKFVSKVAKRYRVGRTMVDLHRYSI